MTSIEPKKSLIVVITALLIILFSLMFIMLNNSSKDFSIQYEQDTSDSSNIMDRLRYYLNIGQDYDEIEEKEEIPETSKHDLLHGDVIMPELGDPVVR